MLSLGKTDVAVKLVSGHLRTLLNAARTGQAFSAQMRNTASHVALRLAAATNDASYADLAIELNLLVKQPLPDEAIDELTRMLPAIDTALFVYYQEALEASLATLPAPECARAERILALRTGI
jgi:hypothetical protein